MFCESACQTGSSGPTMATSQMRWLAIAGGWPSLAWQVTSRHIAASLHTEVDALAKRTRSPSQKGGLGAARMSDRIMSSWVPRVMTHTANVALLAGRPQLKPQRSSSTSDTHTLTFDKYTLQTQKRLEETSSNTGLTTNTESPSSSGGRACVRCGAVGLQSTYWSTPPVEVTVIPSTL